MRHECGLAVIYHLPSTKPSPLISPGRIEQTSRLMPRMLLDVQNRGQLSAGITTFNPTRNRLLTTYKQLGTVTEAFRLNHRGKSKSLMRMLDGRAAIGHVRYATCGQDDVNNAHPLEREHVKRHKWFSFAFNGQLANYDDLRRSLLRDEDNYLSRDNDGEIIMHEISERLSRDESVSLLDICRHLSERADGAYSIVLLNALGDMLVARDPLGIKPLCYAYQWPLFAAASESVALLNLGFSPEQIHPVPPGHAITISDGKFDIQPFHAAPSTAHCFFEWVYFSNVASTMDGRSVYLSRKVLGEELAKLEDVEIDESTIVVPVPDTSKAAADAMAYQLNVPSLEGLIRNRYMGRTFIENGQNRRSKARSKYTPLREVLEGKRVLLVEDSIVRSTTMRSLLSRVRKIGGAREIHVRVASPPIVSPCFYGIDMSTVDELFAPKFMQGGPMTPEIEREMARELGADSLRYLPVEAISRAIGLPSESLCQACITRQYPTPAGRRLYQIALDNAGGEATERTYETAATVTR